MGKGQKQDLLCSGEGTGLSWSQLLHHKPEQKLHTDEHSSLYIYYATTFNPKFYCVVLASEL